MAAFVWDGGGNNISYFQGANWVGDVAPPNPTTNMDVLIDDTFVTPFVGGTLGDVNGVSANIQIGQGFNFSVLAGSFNFAANRGIFGTAGGVTEQFIVGGSAILYSQFAGGGSGAGLDVTLSGDGLLRLTGAGNPLTGSTVDFNSFGATLEFTNEDVASVQAEHLSKFTVFGKTGVENVNLLLTPAFGGNGTIVSVIPTPEPSTLVLSALGLLSLTLPLIRRRRDRRGWLR